MGAAKLSPLFLILVAIACNVCVLYLLTELVELLLLSVFLQDAALKHLVVLVLREVLKGFCVQFTSFLKDLL